MKEKLQKGKDDRYTNGIWKPKGKREKRRIHKKVRRMKNVFRSVMNKVGTFWEYN